ncbi:hydroxyacid dehydrogenase [Desulfosarcina ovata]|uniref:Glyoxylate reductase n=1 Tax=Desulfosarcina ovata subsp. ovata TaxID=2752305 RepID=A0A5K8AHF0_9BACT|nr:hydroxyacid dehydrogenase [Desulfosarcina ovata]BBO92123.1 hypothetical protein DSCOOX_53030 [Desulfosarcina ovata subsp. ovata]
MRKTILLIEPTIIPEGVIRSLMDRHRVMVAPDGKTETLIQWIRKHQANAVIPNLELIEGRVIEACPSLEVIGQPGVGTDNIDVVACTEHGIPVVHAPAGNAVSVAEHTMMFILALSRDLTAWDSRVRQNIWQLKNSFLPFEIRNKVLFIIGMGRSGREVARLALAFGMRVMGYRRHPSPEVENFGAQITDSLSDGLSNADFVSLHVPLNAQTHHMISVDELACMKKSAFMINVSRGQVVDPDALYHALHSHVIAGAALDVMDQEPPAANHPLFGLDNLVLTPHIAGNTHEATKRCVMTVVEEVDKVLCAKPPRYIVNPEALNRKTLQ